MYRAIHIIVAFAVLMLMPIAAGAQPTANPNASAKAKATLAYLQSLPKRSGNKVLIGQMLGYPNHNDLGNNSFSLKPAEEFYALTGKWPAIVGGDYSGRTAMDDSNFRELDYSKVNPTLKAYSDAGGIITLTIHFLNPFPPYGLRDRGFDLALLLKPGAIRNNWIKQLDIVAAGLAELQRDNVVVLFRPFGENTTVGYWYTRGGGSQTADYDATFKKVYADMFDYFTKKKKLNNILWVYNPKTNDTLSFPGDGYVDLVGPNCYDGDWGDRYEQNFEGDLEGMLALNKPFGVFETGPGDPTGYDAAKLIQVLRKQGPKTAFVIAWHEKYRLAAMENLKALADDPWIATREDVVAESGIR